MHQSLLFFQLSFTSSVLHLWFYMYVQYIRKERFRYTSLKEQEEESFITFWTLRLPVDRSKGLWGAWGSGCMGVCSLGASEATWGVGCLASTTLRILSAEWGAVPTSTLTLIPPGWEKPANTRVSDRYIKLMESVLQCYISNNSDRRLLIQQHLIIFMTQTR